MGKPLRAPFPYFGGKSRIAGRIWETIGPVDHYIEPFCGSLAVLLANPWQPKIETVNDADGLLVNCWRAIRANPEAVADAARRPVSELDLKAAKARCESVDLVPDLQRDLDFHDVELAALYLWGQSSTIDTFPRVPRAHAGGDWGKGVHALGARELLAEQLRGIRDRLRHVRIMCGDWNRPLRSALRTAANTLVFLDPPYAGTEGLYNEANSVAHDVYAWASEYDGPATIALCGYEGDYEDMSAWDTLEWRGSGYQSGGEERVWIKWPHSGASAAPRRGQVALFG